MFLVAGLGNPGKGYAQNRHNIGFMAVDELVRRHNFAPFREKFKGRICEGKIGGQKVLALQPETYMNLSGESVAKAANFYKIPPENVIVIHDDLDLAPGKLKVKKGGGNGGHNGLKSIDAHLGKDYWRIRIGIGHPGHKDRVADYVLHDFAKADEEWITPLLDAIAQALPFFVRKGGNAFTTRVSLVLDPDGSNKPKKKQKKPGAPETPPQHTQQNPAPKPDSNNVKPEKKEPATSMGQALLNALFGDTNKN